MAYSDWRKPPYPVQTADYATYIQLISWFLDSPSPLCPFSVHRMALAGKDLGKEVGQWFGPSTAAGAIKYVITLSIVPKPFTSLLQYRALVHAFPKAGLGVSVAVDSVIYQSDVYAASHNLIGSPKRHIRMSWGNRGVLVLIGTRLGIDGVNPVYYEAIKVSPVQRGSYPTRCCTVSLILIFHPLNRRSTLGPSQLGSRVVVHLPHTTLSALRRTTSSTWTLITPDLPFRYGPHPGSMKMVTMESQIL